MQVLVCLVAMKKQNGDCEDYKYVSFIPLYKMNLEAAAVTSQMYYCFIM